MLSARGRRGILADLIREYRSKGWNVSMTGGGHYKFQAPAGGICYVSATPRTERGHVNARADLRRMERHPEHYYKDNKDAGNESKADPEDRA